MEKSFNSFQRSKQLKMEVVALDKKNDKLKVRDIFKKLGHKVFWGNENKIVVVE